MAGKSQYSDADKARVFVTLAANTGNVKRTARETGVPENTVRRWKAEFEENPPAAELIEAEATTFTDLARKVRHEALVQLRKKIPDAKVSELVATVGMLDDKVTRVEGIDRQVRVDHHHHLPSADEVRELLGGLRIGAIEQARQRQAELVDAELVEQAPKALPAHTN